MRGHPGAGAGPGDDVEKIAEVIAGAARPGEIGDGKIWVAPVLHAMRIRTGELGSDAL